MQSACGGCQYNTSPRLERACSVPGLHVVAASKLMTAFGKRAALTANRGPLASLIRPQNVCVWSGWRADGLLWCITQVINNVTARCDPTVGPVTARAVRERKDIWGAVSCPQPHSQLSVTRLALRVGGAGPCLTIGQPVVQIRLTYVTLLPGRW